ncbi:MAG: T9SS type A sorting domain-containing protein [Bacteroidia bacterium]|nr:T9SS type A sorting domain-containing protein [Bacteroidia bacterium]
MKQKLLKLLTIVAVGSANAQTVPNGSFENWALLPSFEHPVVAPAPVFMSSNSDSYYQHGILTVTKVTGVSGFGMRVETIQAPNGDTLKGMAAWGNVNGPSMSGGIPLPGNQALTGATASIKYDMTPTTPGFIGFIPTNNGSPAGAGNGIFPGAYIFPLSGVQASFTATTFTFSPALTINPDSCIIVIAAADVINDIGTPGDFLEIDNLAWTGTTDVLPGGDLDIWQMMPSPEAPSPWRVDIRDYPGYTFGKSTDAAKGMYSLLLRNIGSSPDLRIGQASLGYYDCPSGSGPCTTVPGMQLNSTPNAVGFYYKYTTSGVDTASAGVSLTKVGVGSVGGNWNYLLPAANWTFRSMNLGAMQTPDSAFLSFESGRWQTGVNGSTLLVDDVKFHFCNEATPVVGPTSVCVNSSGVQFNIDREFASNLQWSTTTGAINGSSTNDQVVIDNIAAGGTITVVKSYTDGCPDKTFNLTITTTSAASATAGGNQSVCSADSLVLLNGSVSGATGGNWTTNGTGAFNDPNMLNATYIPSSTDVSNGTVQLTLTPTGTGGCAVSTSNLTVTINATPSVSLNLGLNDTVCVSDAAFTLSGGLPTGGDYSGAFVNGSEMFDPAAAGVGTHAVTYTYTAGNSCTNSVVKNIVVETCVPTSIISQNEIVTSIYPNPSNGEFTIKINNNNAQYALEVFDITGKVIHSENSNKSIHTVDLKDVSAGIYFVKITAAHFNMNAKLIVK